MEPMQHYCVLHTQTLKQERLRRILARGLPEGAGTVFYPCMEAWHRDAGGRLEVRAMFPGYVFIRSGMGAEALHRFVGEHRGELDSFIRELRLCEERSSGGPVLWEGEPSDLGAGEARFMDRLLEMDGGGPMRGLLRMSYGYREGGGYRVMEGPLRGLEGHIRDASAHDRRAYLDVEICGRAVRAGLTVLPKRRWLPDDEGAPEVLADGSEVDLAELARRMTRLQGGK